MIASTARGDLVAISNDGRSRRRACARWTRRVHAGWAWSVTSHALGLASCGDDGRIAITDATGTRTETHAGLGVACRALVAAPSGLVAGDVAGSLHAITTNGVVTTWAAHLGAITSLAADAGTIVSGSEDGHLIRWIGTEGELVSTAPDFVTSVTCDRGGVVCAGYDGAIWRA